MLSVEIEGDKLSHIVGLPGRVQTSLQTGSGNLAEFARALAGWYRSPVLVEVAQPTQPVRWNFTQSGPTEAASAALQDMPFTVESRDPNLVRIADR
ncbi:MAG: hypothetical protein HY248_05020 [Fimbriimonas ginsengisoli]|nr:hypothetical protein [Fimbriimonas ginsengisoli]